MLETNIDINNENDITHIALNYELFFGFEYERILIDKERKRIIFYVYVQDYTDTIRKEYDYYDNESYTEALKRIAKQLVPKSKFSTIFDLFNNKNEKNESEKRHLIEIVGGIPEFSFPSKEGKEWDVYADLENKKIVFIFDDDKSEIKYDILKDESHRDALYRIYKQLTNPNPNPPATHATDEQKEQKIEIDEKEIKKITKNITNGKFLLTLFCRGGGFVTTGKLSKDNKAYKEFIMGKNVIKLENSFYYIEQRGYILTTQHKKLLLTILNTAKKVTISAEGRIIIYTTVRKIATRAGFCTTISYSKKVKENTIDLLKQLQTVTISIKNKIDDKEISFSFIDETRRENDDFIITFSNIFSNEIRNKYLLFLPKNLDFTLPALIFDTILYFTSQKTHTSNKKISFEKILEILHAHKREKRSLYEYKKILRKYETILQTENFY